MTDGAAIAEALQRHLHICREVFALTEAEAVALKDPDAPRNHTASEARKRLLPELTKTVDQVKQARRAWQDLSPEQRSRCPSVAGLLRQCRDLIMKIIVLDRDNEQALLRQGLVPPSRLPSVNRQRPHFVADLYLRATRP